MFVLFSYWRMLSYYLSLPLSVCFSGYLLKACTCTHTHTCPFVLGNIVNIFCVAVACQNYTCTSLLHRYITTCRSWCSHWGKALLTGLGYWDGIQEGLMGWASSTLWRPSFHLVKWSNHSSLQKSATGINKDKETKALLRCLW